MMRLARSTYEDDEAAKAAAEDPNLLSLDMCSGDLAFCQLFKGALPHTTDFDSDGVEMAADNCANCWK